jgi:diacylglycerol O-acyltransferase / trehalose O-mycolyltransferase
MWGSAKRSGNGTPGDNYVAAGGTNGVYWGQQLQQMKPDLQRVLGATSRR